MNTQETLQQNTQTSVDQQDKQNLSSNEKQLVEVHDVPGLPFKIIKNDKEWHVVLGRYRLTGALETREEAEEDAKRVDWDRMLQVMTIVADNSHVTNEVLKEMNEMQEKGGKING